YNKASGLRTMVVSGVRVSESERRKINITSECQTVDSINWVSPLMNWDEDDKEEFLEENNVELSPVSRCTGHSYECLCGAFARKGELAHLKEFYPGTAKVIEELQNILYQIGFTWGW